MSSFNNNIATPNFDNLLLQSLMGRLQLNPQQNQQQHQSSFPSTPNLDDFFLDYPFSLSSSSDDENEDSLDSLPSKSQLAKEEARLEKDLIKIILSGETESLKPNSGQAVSIGEHHICVGFHEEEKGSDYRVWEWHGHIMLFDDENGYTPEYIYGNYFERVVPGGGRKVVKVKKKDKEAVVEKEGLEGEGSVAVSGSGLRDLIKGEEDVGSRIVHRSRNAGGVGSGAGGVGGESTSPRV